MVTVSSRASLAAAAKIAGEKNPVGYVRKHYISNAVETAKQMDYIAKLDVGPAQRLLASQAAAATTLGDKFRYYFRAARAYFH